MARVSASPSSERRVIEWLTTTAKGRQWEINATSRDGKTVDAGKQGSVFLLNYYAVRYGYDLVLAH
jgi:hypothetical protein